MKNDTLERIAPLLAALRGYSALVEVRPGTFHHRGRDFIHFHDELDGVFADVRLARGQVRMSVATQADQAELLEGIEETLFALESHSRGTRTNKRCKRDNEGQGDD